MGCKTWQRSAAGPTACGSCSVTATAPSRRLGASPSGASIPSPWRWAASMATASWIWRPPTPISVPLPIPIRSVLLGNGDGTFQTERHFFVGGNVSSVAVADFNGDGRQDLAVADYGDGNSKPGFKVWVLLGNGEGTFQAPVGYPVGQGPVSIFAGDFNGDGVKDLVVPIFAANAGTTVQVLVGNGDGTFKAAQSFLANGGVAGAGGGGFNGDGQRDLG